MTLSQVIQRIGQISPPIQPKIRANVKHYTEATLKWNPDSVKGYALFYQFLTDSNPSSISLIPDGCVNILFRCDERAPAISLAGIMLKEQPLQLLPNTTYFGFKPYSPAAIEKKYLKTAALLDDKVDFKHYFPEAEQLLEQVLQAPGFQERLRLLLKYAQKHFIDHNYVYALQEYLALSMCVAKGQKSIGELVKTIGYSGRHCRKRFKNLFGITLAHYNRIMRFQNAVKTFYHNDHISMTTIAHESGYFDQAHFIRDFKRFVDDPPQKFKQNLA